MPNCPNCGRPYEEGPDSGRYCDSCGYDLRGESRGEPSRPMTPVEVQSRGSTTMIKGQGSRTLVVVLIVVMIALAALLGVVYFQSSGTISNLNSSITAQQGALAAKTSMIAALNGSIASDVAKISADLGTISTLNSTVVSLKSQVNSDKARITALTGKSSQDNATIASLNSQITTLNSKISTDQSTITTLQTQVSNLQSAYSAFLAAVDKALANPNSVLYDSNYQFSTLSGYYYQFPFTAVSYNQYIIVGLVSSTSSNTTISDTGTTSGINLGNAGVAVFYIPSGTAFNLNVYAPSFAAFSATVNIWGFH